jgi:hypothetical protein
MGLLASEHITGNKGNRLHSPGFTRNRMHKTVYIMQVGSYYHAV